MTYNEVVKYLEKEIKDRKLGYEYFLGQGHYPDEDKLKNIANIQAVLDFINRQKAEVDELTYKLECLLCHATGNLLSKSTYPLRTMETAVTDYIEKCCNEAKVEVRSEAYNEFAARANEKLQNLARIHMHHGSDDIYFLVSESFIDNVLKELTEEKK